ncbi:hypothetical protein RFI_27927 [Reticulomyxa filosa]|uniref:Phosphoribulokinase/uridine kinase domain-containing protein n=1 Tax=Reticulomyxa filosa TaxID=46433 RepID=X6M8V4_RETFI|nr:hypothetical protein RFI_27927 [Reticulomyxa filosa]|eukprot:ETO09450.1 hypothetical protein RFI_27927 [Reticulomyxa filosa]
MDGFHLSRQHLDHMTNPTYGHRKRGSYWTFDPYTFSSLLHRIANDTDKVIEVPTFDHAIKDPTPNGKSILPTHRILICEGLYLFLNVEPWKSLVQPQFRIKIFLDCDDDLARTRIVKRHVQSGISSNEQEALFRWEDNDRPNGVFLQRNLTLTNMDVVLRAVDPHGVKITHNSLSSSSSSSFRHAKL